MTPSAVGWLKTAVWDRRGNHRVDTLADVTTKARRTTKTGRKSRRSRESHRAIKDSNVALRTCAEVDLDHRLVHIFWMTHVSVSDAKAQLTDLIRRAEAGEEIVVTRHGQGVVKLTPVAKPALSPEERLKLLREIQDSVKGKFEPGFSAARSQDFLYDEDGLPG